MKHKLLLLTIAVFMGIGSAFSQNEWPREISAANGGKLTVYEPQPESLSGNEMTGRAAVAYRKTPTSEPVFGAIIFNATVQNGSSGKLDIQSFNVTRAKFSGMEDQQQVEDFTAKLEQEAPEWNWNMTKAEVEEAVSQEQGSSQASKFNNAPPKIIYADKPSTLVVLDGDPKISRDKNIDADKVANSPNLIFKENGQWNLYSGGKWYRSTNITNGWSENHNLSSKVKSVNESIRKQEKENNSGKALETEPQVTDILVATEPTELIQTNGEPEYKNVAGTSLLYVANSPNEIFKDINSQKTYILLAGRWYRSSTLNGPWEYIPADRLPADFAKIPDGSDKEEVLASVAGTDAAEDARMSAYVPQTAKVDRRTATIDVEYDGDPYFTRIEGTSLRLAENANLTVVEDSHGNYFALDNGIWFISDDPLGPWTVANDRPRDIDRVPASSPAYYSRYVYVYDVTPDYVYTGYTSGYLGSYFYGPTIVYGTGWHYRPWYRSVYYPRPFTWGFGFMYDPWYGWNMNWGYNYGFLHIGFNFGGPGYYGYGGGWFGPSRYCPPYRRNYYWNDGYYYRDRNYYGSRRNNYDRNLYGGGGRPDRNSVVNNNGVRGPRNYNLYNNQRGVVTRDVSRTARVYRPANSTVANSSNGLRDSRDRFNNRLNRDGSQRPALNGDNSTVTPATPNNTNRRLERNNTPREPVVNDPVNRTDNNRSDRRLPQYNRPQTREDNNSDNTSRELPRVNRPEPRENTQRELPRVNRPEPRENTQRELPRVNRPEQRQQQSAPRETQRLSRPEPRQQQSAPRESPRVSRPEPRSSSPSQSPRVDGGRGRRLDRN